jgi:hypothetical protein
MRGALKISVVGLMVLSVANLALGHWALAVDACTRCADTDCRTDTRHDAGHRCRKGA